MKKIMMLALTAMFAFTVSAQTPVKKQCCKGNKTECPQKSCKDCPQKCKDCPQKCKDCPQKCKDCKKACDKKCADCPKAKTCKK